MSFIFLVLRDEQISICRRIKVVIRISSREMVNQYVDATLILTLRFVLNSFECVY